MRKLERAMIAPPTRAMRLSLQVLHARSCLQALAQSTHRATSVKKSPDTSSRNRSAPIGAHAGCTSSFMLPFVVLQLTRVVSGRLGAGGLAAVDASSSSSSSSSSGGGGGACACRMLPPLLLAPPPLHALQQGKAGAHH